MPATPIPSSLLALVLANRLAESVPDAISVYDINSDFLRDHHLSLYSDADDSTDEVVGLSLEQDRDRASGRLTLTLRVTTSFDSSEYEITDYNHTEYWFVSYAEDHHPLLSDVPHIPTTALPFLSRNVAAAYPLHTPIELTPVEAHAFLSQILPTVPSEIIAQWSLPLPLSLSASPEWPEPPQQPTYRYSVNYTPSSFKAFDPHIPRGAVANSRTLAQSTAQPLHAPHFATDTSLAATFLFKAFLCALPSTWRSYFFGKDENYVTHLPINGATFNDALHILLRHEIPYYKTYLQYLPAISSSKAPFPSDPSAVNLEDILQHANPDNPHYDTVPFHRQLNTYLRVLEETALEISRTTFSC